MPPGGPDHRGSAPLARSDSCRAADTPAPWSQFGDAREGSRFLCPCKCLFFNSFPVRTVSVRGRRPVLSWLAAAGGRRCKAFWFATPILHTAPLCPTPSAHPFTLTPTLSLNTFIIVGLAEGTWGRSAPAAAAGGLIFIFALQ